jgi:hypothetical protein
LERISEVAQKKRMRSIAGVGGAVAGKVSELGIAANEAVLGKDKPKEQPAQEGDK